MAGSLTASLLLLAVAGQALAELPSDITWAARPSAAGPDTGAGGKHGAATAGSGNVVLVALRKAGARDLQAADGTGFFVGTVAVGHPEPQEFSVLFDTASGNIMLPSVKCRAASCADRHLYSPALSSSSMPINVDGTPVRAGDKTRDGITIEFSQIDVGDGNASGTLVRDRVCFGGAQACVDLGIVAASSLQDVPFRTLPYDGMVGLGLDGLSAASPLFSLIRSVSPGLEGMLPQFSLTLRGSVGRLTLGGQDPSWPPSRPLRWFPVARPADGYWQVQVLAVHVGNRTLEACAGGCRGIIDSGAAGLGVPAPLVPKLAMALTAAPAAGGGCQGPDLHFELLGGQRLTLHAQDYAGPSCSQPRLLPLDLDPADFFAGALVFGESLLRRYDTVYDWGLMRIGFSPSAMQAVRLGPPVPEAQGRPSLPRVDSAAQMMFV